MYMPTKKIEEAKNLAKTNKGITYYVVKYGGRYHVHSEMCISLIRLTKNAYTLCQFKEV